MFSSCFKITKTCKEIKCIVKIVYPEWQAHIMLVKLKGFIFSEGVLTDIFFCKCNAVKRNINTSYGKTFFCKYAAVSTATTGNIQHIAAGSRFQVINEC